MVVICGNLRHEQQGRKQNDGASWFPSFCFADWSNVETVVHLGQNERRPKEVCVCGILCFLGGALFLITEFSFLNTNCHCGNNPETFH